MRLGPTLIASQPGRTHRSHSPRSDEGVVARLRVVECDDRNADEPLESNRVLASEELERVLALSSKSWSVAGSFGTLVL
jgi:hypothetical protein